MKHLLLLIKILCFPATCVLVAALLILINLGLAIYWGILNFIALSYRDGEWFYDWSKGTALDLISTKK